VADDGLRRSFPSPAFDDSAWERVTVPHHWQAVPAFSASAGPLLYRRRFAADVPHGDERAWLVFDGIFYQGDVWLDGSYLGDSEGWFFPHEFEVTDRLARGGEHLLAVEVGCEALRAEPAHRTLLGIWDDPSWSAPGRTPGGIWAPVRLVRTGPVKISSVRVSCREARASKAVVEVSVELDSAIASSVEVHISARRLAQAAAASPNEATPSEATPSGAITVAQMLLSHPLALGHNRSRWRVEIPEPQLWWPRGLGDQPFYQLELEVYVAGQRSDGRSVRTGLRELRMRDMRWSVNGERLFLMGADLSLPRPGVAWPGTTDLVVQLDQARRLGLGMVRPRAYVAGAALYDRADETGMLVWQDMPLHGRYRGPRRQATSQAHKMTELLGHHPSVIAWCAHDYPSEASARRRVWAAWEGIVLDRAVRRSLERTDPSRPALSSTGPFPGRGWARRGPAGEWPPKRPAGIPLSAVVWPASFRFVPSVPVPSVSAVVPLTGAGLPGAGPTGVGPTGVGPTGVGPTGVGPAAAAPQPGVAEPALDGDPDGSYEVMRHQLEALRRAQWRPVGGFLLQGLPREPGVAQGLRDACAPLIVTATWPGQPLVPGTEVVFDIHTVAGPGYGVSEATVVAFARWPGGGRRWVFAGEAAVGTSFVGRGRFTVPSNAVLGQIDIGGAPPGLPAAQLVLELVASSGQCLASNRYKSQLRVP
jgi:beta-mannosidase